MSVRPIAFNADGSVVVVTDDNGHTGTIPVTSIGFRKLADGTSDPLVIVLACPDGCGVTSPHPAGGGASPAAIQELFARTVARLGCPCPSPVPAGRPLVIAQSHAKLHAERVDWTGRWAIAGNLK